MRVGAITREAVLKAIAECDEMGNETFLQTYSFGRARSYLLVYQGREYDSKAIAGVAHKFDHGRPLKPNEFSGGRDHAAAWLQSIGFQIKAVRNPDWAWDELVLACEMVADNDWHGLDAKHPRVIEVSDLLQKMPVHPLDARNETFRNPNGVARKTYDIATRHPDYTGKRTNGGALDEEVLKAFLTQPDVMRNAARLIRSGLTSGDLLDGPPLDAEELEDYSAPEGRLLLRRHLSRERNRGLRKRKIEAVLRQRGRLACEACDFDFAEQYGDRGEGYIECHHVVPLHEAGAGRTTLADLALICANCHRMIHRRAPWPTPSELRTSIMARREARAPTG